MEPPTSTGTPAIPRLAGQLDAALHDLLETLVQELARELPAVGAERVRLDQLRAGPDEAQVDADHRLGRFQVRLLGVARSRGTAAESSARAAVRDDRSLGEALEESAHALSVASRRPARVRRHVRNGRYGLRPCA